MSFAADLTTATLFPMPDALCFLSFLFFRGRRRFLPRYLTQYQLFSSLLIFCCYRCHYNLRKSVEEEEEEEEEEED